MSNLTRTNNCICINRTSSGGHASVPSSPSKPESISTPNSGNSIDAGLTSLSP
eukprot:Awhi_evm1s12243